MSQLGLQPQSGNSPVPEASAQWHSLLTEGSENHHKSLAPAMSTLIIIGHVKDGLELAEEHNLQDPHRLILCAGKQKPQKMKQVDPGFAVS